MDIRLHYCGPTGSPEQFVQAVDGMPGVIYVGSRSQGSLTEMTFSASSVRDAKLVAGALAVAALLGGYRLRPEGQSLLVRIQDFSLSLSPGEAALAIHAPLGH